MSSARHMENIQQPALGVALLIQHQGKILIGQRRNEPMPGSWQLPGGWVFNDETPQRAVYRQIKQFQGMSCSGTHCVSFTNNKFEHGLHSLSLYYQCVCLNVEDLDLNKNTHCDNWFWADWNHLPEDLFLPLRLLVESDFRLNLD